MARKDGVVVTMNMPRALHGRLEAFKERLARRSPFSYTSMSSAVLQTVEEGLKVIEMQEAEEVAAAMRTGVDPEVGQ